jgi:rhodanese-related sulfurtransferase
MPDDLRIGIEDLRKRMESGEDFVFIDTRNPQAWAQSDVTLPNAIRVPVDNFEEYLDKIPRNKSIVAYCT